MLRPLVAARLLLALLACWRGGEGRVRLNSIRTVILRDGHMLPLNRSGADLTLYQCMSDLECSEGSYCHAPTKGPAHSRCQTCRKKKRRCHRDGMCCPGNRCSNSVCLPDLGAALVSQSIPDWVSGSVWKQREWRRRDPKEPRDGGGKGQVGDPCLRSSDCSDALCCARHFWTRICKPVLQEGQVCTRHGRRAAGGRRLELFQRCPCGGALSCRALRERGAEPPSSSSSSLLAAAVGSKFAPPPPRRSAPLIADKSSPLTTAKKTRLYVCQKD